MCSDCGKRPAVIDGRCLYCRSVSYRIQKDPIKKAIKESISLLESVQGGCCYMALMEIRVAIKALEKAHRLEQCI